MTRMTRLFGRTTVCGLCLVCLAACKDAPQQSGGAQYKTLTLSPTDRTLTREYTAVVEGRQSVEIRPQVSGTITEVCIDEGAKVSKGQPLFIIDQVPYGGTGNGRGQRAQRRGGRGHRPHDRRQQADALRQQGGVRLRPANGQELVAGGRGGFGTGQGAGNERPSWRAG